MIQITENVKSLLEESNVSLATCNRDLQPNNNIIANIEVISDNQLLFTDNYFNKTRQNLEQNSKVALSVCSTDGNEAYQLKGIARIFVEGEYKKMVDEMECNQGLAHKAAILVTVTEIWDLANPQLICQS